MPARFLAPILTALALTATASAAVTEVNKSIPNLTAPLSATAIMSAPSATANYLLCVTTTSAYASGPPPAILFWTDENGYGQTAAASTAACTLIRNRANTAPAVAVAAWNSSEPYNIYIWGLGFWPIGTEAQGGIKETVNATFGPLQSSANLSGDELIAVTHTQGTGTCSWSVGSITGAGAAVFPLRVVGSVSFFNNSSACEETVIVVNFAAPSPGPGPLTDYEYTLLAWTDATYPYSKTVFTAGSSGANILMAANIAESPNSGKVNEELYVVGGSGSGSSTACVKQVGSSGAPANCVTTGYLAASNTIQLETINEGGLEWGVSPTYSAEVDIIQF
jgi:hypothetical protein